MTNKLWIYIAVIFILLLLMFGIIFIVVNKKSEENSATRTDITNEASDIICDSDTYNCADFVTQSQAQEVFDFCGPEDVHGLDNDADGEVCESLP